MERKDDFMAEKTEKKETAEAKFSKAQLIKSKKFAGKADVLNALLSDDEFYTIGNAEGIVEKYLKGKVI